MILPDTAHARIVLHDISPLLSNSQTNVSLQAYLMPLEAPVAICPEEKQRVYNGWLVEKVKRQIDCQMTCHGHVVGRKISKKDVLK